MDDLRLVKLVRENGHYEVAPSLVGKYYPDVVTKAWRLPSVTTVISRALPSDSFESWLKSVGVSKAKHILAASARRGKNVHKAIECLLKREKLPDLSPKESLYVSNLIPFLKNVTPILSEQAVFWVSNHGIGYAGTLDCVLRVPMKDTNYLVDIKTWSNPCTDSNRLSRYALQIVAYAGALNFLTKGIYRINQGLILGVTPYGAQILHIDREQMRKAWYIWIDILKAFYNNSVYEGDYSVEFKEFDDSFGSDQVTVPDLWG